MKYLFLSMKQMLPKRADVHDSVARGASRKATE